MRKPHPSKMNSVASADAQSDLGIRCAHIREVSFSPGAALK